MTGQAEGHEKCISCGRRLFCAISKRRGYGWGCWARKRRAIRLGAVINARFAEFTARQLADAAELVEDCAVIPTAMATVFRTVSHDGLRIYLTTVNGCTCLSKGPCFHRAGVIMATS
jgi:hypothetical protein